MKILLVKKLFFPVCLGLFGTITLCMLGTWQLNRLTWKNNLISEVSKSISMEPQKLEIENIDLNSQYLPVKAEGKFLDTEIHVLFSLKPYGPGFKIIKPFKLKSDEIILVDLGFVPEDKKKNERKINKIKILGNILFPNETDHFTPLPNFTKNIWFSRDLEKMAISLNTQPILVILSSKIDENDIIATPLTPKFLNNHLQYSITWFSMAIAWLFMSIYFIIKVIRNNQKEI